MRNARPNAAEVAGGSRGAAARGLVAVVLLAVSAAAAAADDGLSTAALNDLEPARPHEFYFTRGMYASIADSDPWGPRWAIDFPEADRHFLVALTRLSVVDAYPLDNALPLDGAEVRDHPFVYVVEAGALELGEKQARALREYLLAGGFMMVDDFWGSWALDNLVAQMRRVFPERPMVEVPLDHPVFHAFYDIPELLQVPNVALASGERTWEYDGRVPAMRGIFDDSGRLMVLVNWNTDLGDAWEWADSPEYPLRYSNFAYKLGINIVIYALTY